MLLVGRVGVRSEKWFVRLCWVVLVSCVRPLVGRERAFATYRAEIDDSRRCLGALVVRDRGHRDRTLGGGGHRSHDVSRHEARRSHSRCIARK